MRKATALVAVTALALVAAGGGAAANAHSAAAVCPAPPAGYTHCHVLVVTDEHGNPQASSSPTGLSPADIKNAYNFPASGGAGKTIGIVDAYDDPNAVGDLNV